MNRNKTGLAVLLTATMGVANAASVSLIYTGAKDVNDDGVILAAVGDILTFDLVMDFTDRITITGGFDVNWDSSVFAFQEYVSASFGDISFVRDPVLEDGRLFNGAVGSFNGLTAGTIASLSFQLIGLANTYNSSITPSGTDGDSGPWIDGVNGDVIENVEYNGVRVFVPVPATVWFMLSGVGLLAGMGRGC